MSVRSNINASHYLSSNAEPTARLEDWPVRGWTTIAPQHVALYLRLQQRAEHWENRHFDLAVHLRKLNAEQEKGINHGHQIARLERLTDRAGARASAALYELFAAGDRLRGVNEEA